MKEVIRINQQNTEQEKPVEFTQCLSHDGWGDSRLNPNDPNFKDIVYLGKCKFDGDVFAAYTNVGSILIYKGYLNSGKY